MVGADSPFLFLMGPQKAAPPGAEIARLRQLSRWLVAMDRGAAGGGQEPVGYPCRPCVSMPRSEAARHLAARDRTSLGQAVPSATPMPCMSDSTLIPAGHGRAVRVAAGERIRIGLPDGPQVA